MSFIHCRLPLISATAAEYSHSHPLIIHKLPAHISSSSASSLCLDMVDIIRLAVRLLSIGATVLLRGFMFYGKKRLKDERKLV